MQETTQNVSPTLGSSQLKSGLLAGGIGLALVVLYSLLYYRGLGFVTIASLLVSGVLTYGALVILGREIGFTLTLAGIAGFIVAIGITADSFVVFFERIKDEVHDGRSFRVAVPRAWTRARRTIISADFVSFLAAAVLYYLAAGDVRGFAFTLGMSTVLDLVVVFLFTHPLLVLLSRSPTFGSARFTGLNALRTPSPALAYAGAAAARPAFDVPAQEAAVPDLEPEPAGAVSSNSAAADGASAAERAAARRGRTVRPEPEPEADEADEAADEVVDAAPEPDRKPRRLFGRRQAVAADTPDMADERGRQHSRGRRAGEPEAVAEPEPEMPAPRPTVATGATAAERAAARRKRNAEASVESDPTRPVETEDDRAAPVPSSPVASPPEPEPAPRAGTRGRGERDRSRTRARARAHRRRGTRSCAACPDQGPRGQQGRRVTMHRVVSFFRRLYRGETNIQFIKNSRRWYLASGILIALCIIGMVVRGFNLGIEFKGGSQFTVGISGTSITSDDVVTAIESTGDPGAQRRADGRLRLDAPGRGADRGPQHRPDQPGPGRAQRPPSEVDQSGIGELIVGQLRSPRRPSRPGRLPDPGVHLHRDPVPTPDGGRRHSSRCCTT